MAIPKADLVMAFGGGAPKEDGPSAVCRRLAGLLGVPADKIDEFEHLLGAYLDERESEEDEHEEPEEGDKPDGEEEGGGY